MRATKSHYKKASRNMLFIWAVLSFFVLAPAYTIAKTNAIEVEAIASKTSLFPIQSVELAANNQTATFNKRDVNRWITPETTLVFDPSYRSEIENGALCPIRGGFCSIALSMHTKTSLRNIFSFHINQEELRKDIEAFSIQANTEPIDARFSFENGRVSTFTTEQNGIHIDIDQSVEILSQTLLQPSDSDSLSLEIPTDIVTPTVTTKDTNKFGIVELIGEGRTDFKGSPRNRIHNFKRAIQQFDGLLIAPGEEFSFVKYLGEVDGEHGYLPELVIKKGKTEPEFGGGICQVSSTVFRAAIYSGLEITARRNHAYPVRYYLPYGMDATIYVPRPDLRFVNNTPNHILIQFAIEGTELITRFYGTSDGRTTQVDGPHILEREPDGSMKTIFTQTVTQADGTTLIKDDFRSAYESPDKYPHVNENPTEKPDDWSKKQWEDYKKALGR